MHSRNISVGLLIAVVSFTLSARVAAQGTWAVEKTFHVGGEGGMDYITLDAQNHRLYVPRSTHTLVIDADSGKTLADIPGQKHNHGVALVPEAGRGFISDGEGAVEIFDLKTNAVLGTLKAHPDADGIIYDKASGLVLVVSGDDGVLMTVKPDVDPKTGSLDAPIDLGGKPEFLASDGAGKVYINLEDKDQVAVVDLKTRKVLAHWPTTPGGSPVGLSIDPAKHRLFVGCRKPKKLLVMSTDDGRIIADLPIGAGVDATKFDGHQAFASCRDGKLNVAGETAPGKFEIVQTLTTPVGAKTMDVDPATHKIYLPTFEFEEQKPGATGRPTPKPGSFMIVVVGQH
ncbi:MAG TPA: YncE family protein [Candidatus Dormibacteraeota bacterium]|nr:YncE family protein [Candidatus Dormibacteraeota bacterium]